MLLQWSWLPTILSIGHTLFLYCSLHSRESKAPASGKQKAHVPLGSFPRLWLSQQLCRLHFSWRPARLTNRTSSAHIAFMPCALRPFPLHPLHSFCAFRILSLTTFYIYNLCSSSPLSSPGSTKAQHFCAFLPVYWVSFTVVENIFNFSNQFNFFSNSFSSLPIL